MELTTVTFKDVEPSPKAMAKALATANESVIKTLNDSFDKATKANEQGVADFISGRIDMHKKWAWQLRASTK
jgi:DNA-binding ferritin-like protein